MQASRSSKFFLKEQQIIIYLIVQGVEEDKDVLFLAASFPHFVPRFESIIFTTIINL